MMLLQSLVLALSIQNLAHCQVTVEVQQLGITIDRIRLEDTNGRSKLYSLHSTEPISFVFRGIGCTFTVYKMKDAILPGRKNNWFVEIAHDPYMTQVR